MNELTGLNLETGSWVLLLSGLFLVLVFEFINGFHDTANAVATVIYTRTLKPIPAVIWSGLWNFLGAVFSSGAVALSIIALVHGDLLAHPDSSAAMAMIFAIPLAAIAWNFGTWYLGIPASSSHTLIGSILGVGSMHTFMAGGVFGAGVNWHKAADIGMSLLLSPAVGFTCAALLLLLAKSLIKNPALYRAPDEDQKPPLWIRCVLVLTCTGVSFAHGSNDGQKGMGLFMLVLIVMLPTVFAYQAESPLLIPLWVKVSVALALGCGTMIGWKRIVITVGEKIGKSHMTYAQGAAAEIVTMGTIEAASALGLPVSTTHILSSGVAGTMFANKSGLQQKTVMSILFAWVLTLPVSVFLGSAFFGAGTYVILQLLDLH